MRNVNKGGPESLCPFPLLLQRLTPCVLAESEYLGVAAGDFPDLVILRRLRL